MEQVSLSQEQLALFKYIEGEHTNIFVTGRAGTGKSTLLTYLVENTKKNFAVCAPTGVAALNVGGATIHSLFGLPPGLLGTEDVARHLGKRSREVLRSIEMLVIFRALQGFTLHGIHGLLQTHIAGARRQMREQAW